MSGGPAPDDGPLPPGGSPGGGRGQRQPEPGAALGGRGSAPTEPVARADADTGFRVVVDRDLCQGHGACEGEAPEVFEVTKKGELTVLVETPAVDQRRAVEAAVRYCPTHALSIQEDPTP